MDLRAIVVGGVLAGALGGIGVGVYLKVTAPASGYVKSINYDPPSSVYTPGSYSTSCTGYGNGKVCSQTYTQGYTTYYGPEWQLQLCRKPVNVSQGNACGWRDVDEATYHTVRIGQFWPSPNPSEGN